MIWLARAVWFIAAVLAAMNLSIGAFFPTVYETMGADETTGFVLLATVALVGMGYATAGLLILRQRVRHAVGWLLLVAGPLIMAVFAFIAIGTELAQRDHPLAPWLILFASYGWVPAILLAGPILALHFPDGRLPGPRWRTAMRFVYSVLAVSLVAIVLRPGSLDPETGAPLNPIGVDFIPRWVFDLLEASGIFVLIGTLLLGVIAVIVRFRRARPDERQQLKWFVFAVVVWGLLLPPSLIIEGEEFFILAFATLLLVPTAVVIAITRYRLYEIDTLINRTLVYVPLVGVVAGLYAASVALFQRVFVAATGDRSDAAAIISALILAAVFTPIRKAIEGFVDRRFKPASPRADPAAADAPWDRPEFEAAVERVVRRVVKQP